MQEVERTSVVATATETVGCSVAVYAGVDPCPVCPSCTVKPTAEATERRRYHAA
jgi:hypothetical protein